MSCENDESRKKEWAEPSQAEAKLRASHGDGPDYEEKDGK